MIGSTATPPPEAVRRGTELVLAPESWFFLALGSPAPFIWTQPCWTIYQECQETAADGFVGVRLELLDLGEASTHYNNPADNIDTIIFSEDVVEILQISDM